jgi:hypothetical protein
VYDLGVKTLESIGKIFYNLGAFCYSKVTNLFAKKEATSVEKEATRVATPQNSASVKADASSKATHQTPLEPQTNPENLQAESALTDKDTDSLGSEFTLVSNVPSDKPPSSCGYDMVSYESKTNIFSPALSSLGQGEPPPILELVSRSDLLAFPILSEEHSSVLKDYLERNATAKEKGKLRASTLGRFSDTKDPKEKPEIEQMDPFAVIYAIIQDKELCSRLRGVNRDSIVGILSSKIKSSKTDFDAVATDFSQVEGAPEKKAILDLLKKADASAILQSFIPTK